MTTKFKQLTTAAFAVAIPANLHHQFPSCRAQGRLIPPGAPAPMMKTLDQIEPRTPISQTDVPVVIVSPGSFVVIGNLQATAAGMDVITIQSDDVTLDLNGFTIHGAGLGATDPYANLPNSKALPRRKKSSGFGKQNHSSEVRPNPKQWHCDWEETTWWSAEFLCQRSGLSLNRSAERGHGFLDTMRRFWLVNSAKPWPICEDTSHTEN